MRGQASSLGTLNKATKAGWLPVINGQRYTINIIVVLVLTFAMYAYLKYSKQGYEISVVGESENTARYAGINVSRVMIRTMLLSGAICGLCGFLVVAGKDQTISTTSAGGNGFTAIIVAWLAKFNTFYMMLISFLLIFLDRGASEIASAYSLNEYAADIITGIILFFILGSDFFISLIAWILRAIPFGTIIMYGALGETLTEKSGNLNLGVPGIMYLGGFAGFASAYYYEKLSANPSAFVCVILALLCALIASALGGLIYAFLTITLRANQNVTGLALTTFGMGVANFFGVFILNGASYTAAPLAYKAFSAMIPVLSGLGVVGKVLFSYGFLAYAAIVLAVVLHWFFTRTRAGLNLRAVGENPATADAAGINVTLGLAGCSAGHLYHLEAAERHLGRLPVWRAVLAVSVPAQPAWHYRCQLHDRSDPNAALCGYHCGANRGQPAQKEGKPAPGASGPFLLPRGAVKNIFAEFAKNCSFCIKASFPEQHPIC